MRINELMIGDWISSPYGNIQIEFLYNNGYDDVVGEHEEMYLDWDTGEEDFTIVAFSFKYVHELQHLLRLCGLDDLADNFKIE